MRPAEELQWTPRTLKNIQLARIIRTYIRWEEWCDLHSCSGLLEFLLFLRIFLAEIDWEDPGWGRLRGWPHQTVLGKKNIGTSIIWDPGRPNRICFLSRNRLNFLADFWPSWLHWTSLRQYAGGGIFHASCRLFGPETWVAVLGCSGATIRSRCPGEFQSLRLPWIVQ